MSQFHMIYSGDDGYELESFTDQRELNIFVQDYEIEEYSTIKGKFLGNFFNEEALASQEE